MLFLKGHGSCVVPNGAADASDLRTRTSVSEACGLSAEEEAAPVIESTGPFDYYFEDAPVLTDGPAATSALDALANAMVEQPANPADNSSIPPIFTYLGQFIDHDITANTDLAPGLSTIAEDSITAVPRTEVAKNLGNLRAGALNLDSLYGGGPIQGQVAKDFESILRHPTFRAKMWIGTQFSRPGRAVPLPRDPARDLLRLRRVLDQGIPGFSEQDIRKLPAEVRKLFFDDKTGRFNDQRAIIGDARNDENLFVAQLHLAFLRLHNRIVDAAHRFGGPVGDDDELYAWARQQTTWIYQWLVVNVFLKTICDPAVVDTVLRKGAPIYKDFFDRPRTEARKDLLPMPVEFSVAAFRYGHSMVRHSYDWNRFFGRPVDDPDAPERADFALLFAFTGNASSPMFGAPRLPSDWVAEWDRLALPVPPQMPDRATRKIDTRIAFPLTRMANEPGIPSDIFQNLIRRNLRRGLRLNVPCAQDCIEMVNNKFDRNLPALSAEELLSGSTADALKAGGFERKTPLWFYVLKEAEVLGSGEHLGPLGSTLVAETLVGLVVQDTSSYWHQKGSDPDGRWQPDDGVQPENEPIRDLPAMLRAAQVL